jgi:hypothetical protein
MRSLIVAAALLVVLSVVGTLSRPSSQRPQPIGRSATAPGETAVSASVQPHPPVLARAELGRARQAAGRFLASYLRFAYGQAAGSAVAPASPTLRRQLASGGALFTPAGRRRHPSVVSLRMVDERPAGAVVAALVNDGGITAYALRVTLRRERSAWVVSAISG